MSSNPWQSYWASWTKMTADMAGSPAAAMPFNPTSPDLPSFIEATRQMLAAAGTHGAATAARTFTEFLRDQYAVTSFPHDSTTAYTAIAHCFPALGSTRQHQERAQRLTEAGLRYTEAQRRLHRLCSDLLSEAASAFAARLVTTAPAQPSGAAFYDLYNQWIDAAEEAYSRTARSESFCDALADSINAMGEWRRDMQASIEDSAKLFDLPTRSELDGLIRRVKSLESEVRAARAGRKLPKTAKRRGARAAYKP